tara:strand:+ start:646 stop:861 length:216 start_codon:yes stop_codon:yes gene_type:complete
MFQPINKVVIGNNNNPLNQTSPIEQIMNIISSMVLFLPDLNERRGNLIKWIGLTIRKQTKDKIIINVLGSP